MSDLLGPAGRTGLLVAAIVYPFVFSDPAALRTGLNLLVLLLGAVSLVPVVGWLRAVSFAAPASAGLAAWASAAALGRQQSLPVVAVVAVAVGALVAVAATAPVLRRPRAGLPWTSLGLLFAVWGLVLPRLRPLPFTRPVFVGIDLGGDRAIYLIGILFVAAATAAIVRFGASPSGRLLIAAGADPAFAARSGGHLPELTLTAAALSGGVAGLAGVLATLVGQSLPPASLFSPAAALAWLAIPVLGGAPWLAGALAGFVVVGGLTELAGLPLAAVGGVALAAGALLPEGVLGPVVARLHPRPGALPR